MLYLTRGREVILRGEGQAVGGCLLPVFTLLVIKYNGRYPRRACSRVLGSVIRGFGAKAVNNSDILGTFIQGARTSSITQRCSGPTVGRRVVLGLVSSCLITKRMSGTRRLCSGVLRCTRRRCKGIDRVATVACFRGTRLCRHMKSLSGTVGVVRGSTRIFRRLPVSSGGQCRSTGRFVG